MSSRYDGMGFCCFLQMPLWNTNIDDVVQEQVMQTGAKVTAWLQFCDGLYIELCHQWELTIALRLCHPVDEHSHCSMSVQGLAFLLRVCPWTLTADVQCTISRPDGKTEHLITL